MRKERDAPEGKKLVLKAGNGDGHGMTVEFTRYFSRNEPKPAQPVKNPSPGNEAEIIEALQKLIENGQGDVQNIAMHAYFEDALASDSDYVRLKAARFIVYRGAEYGGFEELKIRAADVIIDDCVKNRIWSGLRALLDHPDKEIREHADTRLKDVVGSRGREPV